MSKQDTLLARVNKAIEEYLIAEGQLFRGRTADCLEEEDVVSFTLQTVKQRLTQRRKGAADRAMIRELKKSNPDFFMKLRRHRGE